LTTPPKLLGKYKTTTKLGAAVTCARRGDVRIVGLSDAPTPAVRSACAGRAGSDGGARARAVREGAVCVGLLVESG
jgi:hypothetical protein